MGTAEYLDVVSKEMEESSLDIIKNVATNGSQYFFVLDTEANLIMNKTLPEFEHKNILHLKDADGNEFVKNFLKNIEINNTDFIRYKWRNPKSNQIEEKYSYVKKVPNSNWIVGSGFYLDELNEQIAIKQEELNYKNTKELSNIIYVSILLIIASLIVSYFISEMVKKRFFEFTRNIEKKNLELKKLNASLEDKVTERTKELQETNENMKKIAITDSLTQIYNRYYFINVLKNEILRTQRYNFSFSLVMFDIDYFKKINDTFGHDAGDKILSEIAKIISNTLRESDIFARVGGEEFMIILPQTELYMAKEIALRIKSIVEFHQFPNDQKVTISLGLVAYRADESQEDILKRVDVALYEAKSGGRNRLIVEN